MEWAIHLSKTKPEDIPTEKIITFLIKNGYQKANEITFFQTPLTKMVIAEQYIKNDEWIVVVPTQKSFSEYPLRMKECLRAISIEEQIKEDALILLLVSEVDCERVDFHKSQFPKWLTDLATRPHPMTEEDSNTSGDAL